jgi:2-polyprenyl-3-methyl-5-hydroxy-6-metoxy-1,4-benzoquinol methylase
MNPTVIAPRAARHAAKLAAHATAKLLLGIGGSLSNREFVGLKKLSRPNNATILPLRYDYRARTGDDVNLVWILSGDTTRVRVFAEDNPQQHWKAGRLLLSSEIHALKRGDIITINLRNPSIARNDKILPVTSAEPPRPSDRRFITQIHQHSGNKRYYRLCSHYLPFTDKQIGQEYYFGDDYQDYSLQTNTEYALSLLRKHECQGRLLDVGCALGIYTKAFIDAGFDAYGVDISPFAIEQATRIVGPDRVKCVDLDNGEVPFVESFDTIWMWDVLEHFAKPEAVLEKVSRRAKRGATLLLHTSNADSLTRRCFVRDWEAYSDYSHRGVDQVTCDSLRQWLNKTGWQVLDFACGEIWTTGVDPVLLRLQQVFTSVPELSVLLKEAELGDLITIAARKQ